MVVVVMMVDDGVVVAVVRVGGSSCDDGGGIKVVAKVLSVALTVDSGDFGGVVGDEAVMRIRKLILMLVVMLRKRVLLLG